GDFYRERVVVTVRASPAKPSAARVEHQVQIALPQNVRARVAERLRAGRVRASRLQLDVRAQAFSAEQPEEFGRRFVVELEARLSEECRADGEQVRVLVRVAAYEGQELAAVRVADERRAPVGPKIRAHVFEHRA